MSKELSELLNFAKQLADIAREITLTHFRHPLMVETKSDYSPVTAIDRETEKVVRDKILNQYPTHGIIGEEFGCFNKNAYNIWVLDPIDGTKSYVDGNPLYTTLIAFVREGTPILGILDAPATGDRWLGVHSSDYSIALFNDKPCHCLSATELELSQVRMSTTTLDWQENSDNNFRLKSLCRGVGQLRLGGDAFSYGGVAAGFSHIVADYAMQPHDYLALLPIILAAGGCISNWEGDELTLQSGESGVLATANTRLHESALKRL